MLSCKVVRLLKDRTFSATSFSEARVETRNSQEPSNLRILLISKYYRRIVNAAVPLYKAWHPKAMFVIVFVQGSVVQIRSEFPDRARAAFMKEFECVSLYWLVLSRVRERNGTAGRDWYALI